MRSGFVQFNLFEKSTAHKGGKIWSMVSRKWLVQNINNSKSKIWSSLCYFLSFAIWVQTLRIVGAQSHCNTWCKIFQWTKERSIRDGHDTNGPIWISRLPGVHECCGTISVLWYFAKNDQEVMRSGHLRAVSRVEWLNQRFVYWYIVY